MIGIYSTVANPRNWMRKKSFWESLLILDWLPYSKVTIRISIRSVEISLSIIIVAHKTYHIFNYQVFQHKCVFEIFMHVSKYNHIYMGLAFLVWMSHNHRKRNQSKKVRIVEPFIKIKTSYFLSQSRIVKNDQDLQTYV